MDNVRAVELNAASERLRRSSGDLLRRARHAVQGSHDALDALRLAREQWDTWKALWRVLRHVPRAQRTLRVCVICRRVRTRAGEWQAIPARLIRGLETRFDMLPLSHGICPACAYEQYGVELDADDSGA